MKKRIAFISEHASPLAVLGGVDSGGQNVYVAEICKSLTQLGYLIDVFTRRDDESLPQVVCWLPNIRVVHLDAGPAREVPKEALLGYMEEFTGSMIHFIHQYQLDYDLVHANFFMSGLVASGIKKRLGIPYVITFHALGKIRMIHQKEKDAFPAERLDIEQMLVNDADFIIAECPQDKQDLIQHYHANPSRITIIPCGFSSEEFYPYSKVKARQRLGLKMDEVVLLQLGRVVPRKGIDNVIRAMRFLKNIPRIKLLVVGGSEEKPDFAKDAELRRLKDIAELEEVSAAVEFVGRRNRQQLRYYYQAADFFISTPWYEPFGITPLEAMACGTPVVGSDVGGIKYTVLDGKTGFLVPPHNPKALAEALMEGVSCPEKYRQLCQNALKHVNENFTWEYVAEKAHQLYDKVTSRTQIKPVYLLHVEQSKKLRKHQGSNTVTYAIP
ncbi:glycosyltransferase family 4 protein [Dyadobacter arcticus]|uniref:Glycosyltransferase involved in cell wall biosynthesis n=1 Tax=Dyadobacter arcticus TaxID=1078754 RepID=A0ABX0UKW2_9BACT|nr:glycosyltransferase family 1 protein [Dyadobacter arcticus]NIJ52724.1 glycosyltransferase involved in cell wall biosynthesis [Dyadobacter arcticus]